jgi:predicted TIM-barrel fold metal-dependent hydrolase
MNRMSPAIETLDPALKEIIISADSHVTEPYDLWARALPWAREQLPVFLPRTVGEGGAKPGGEDPYARVEEMSVDGVSAEVLYPTLGLRLFGMDDAPAQEACFEVYNDWLIEYCRPNQDRLVGIACISMYRIGQAVKELERCVKAGLKGAMIWQVPPPDLPFNSPHYDAFWEAAQALGMPISLHILTGHNYTKDRQSYRGVEHYRASVHLKILEAANALMDLTFHGVLDRYPGLKIVTVENEIGWLPFYLQQWDYYYGRHRRVDPPAIDREPSSYFYQQVYATFFNDAVGGHNFNWWGQDNCMWSSDYPHANSTWPRSRQVIDRDLGHLAPEVRAKLVRGNVAALYGMAIPQPA